MTQITKSRIWQSLSALVVRLAQDRAGNTLAIIAASMIPLLAMVGGAIDMGRGYLSQSRLQQACDSGVLAARKKFGSQVVTGALPEGVRATGDRFFNLNFRKGDYGTKNRSFTLSLDKDSAISGSATVDVPTTLMGLFGFSNVPIKVSCQARLNFSDTDIMFVLDTTGSMADTNVGDTEPKINILRSVVKSFYKQLEGTRDPGTRIRYGFVPYATNVNVGALLKSDWMVDKWTYQSREPKKTGTSSKSVYNYQYDIINEGRTPISYVSDFCPFSNVATVFGPTTYISTNPEIYWYNAYYDGDAINNCTKNDSGKFNVTATRYTNHVQKTTVTYLNDKITDDYIFTYKPIEYDVSSLKGASGNDPMLPGKIQSTKIYIPADDGTPTKSDVWYEGCIEERATYQIDDYSNVDLTKALDLDIDLVPTPGNSDTQWRPQFRTIIFDRAMWWDNTGSFSPTPIDQYNDFLAPGWSTYAACPTPARNLSAISEADMGLYLDNLTVAGSTYHDIGMIWGGRLLSPTGLFATENADRAGKQTQRNLIFLTDGETAPLDLSYGSYGVEPLDQRRWSPSSAYSLTQVVENRFTVACEEVKKRNITVWIIGFGTKLNPIMKTCAGNSHYFEAKDAAALSDVFSNIAAQLGDLRISK